jgi:hypothetical protein
VAVSTRSGGSLNYSAGTGIGTVSSAGGSKYTKLKEENNGGDDISIMDVTDMEVEDPVDRYFDEESEKDI